MEFSEREYLLAQIIANTIVINIGNKTFLYKNVSTENKYIAQEIYRETYQNAYKDGVLEDDDLLQYLIMNDLWNIDEENRLEKMDKELPDLKIKLYEIRSQINEREMIRHAINKTRGEIETLYNKRHSYDYLTCRGVAYAAKIRYLTGSALIYKGRPYWKDIDDWNKSDNIIEKVISIVNQHQVGERQLRELARTEPWRSLWDTAKYAGQGVFGLSAIDLSDNQKLLIRYARMYDNIAESQEPPPEFVIEDDDMLDGWMLLQKKNKDAESCKEDILSRVGDKIKNCEEIFIKPNDTQEIQAIQNMNDISGKIAFAQRMKQIKEEKVVNEIDLKETRLQLQMRANQKFAENMRS